MNTSVYPAAFSAGVYTILYFVQIYTFRNNLVKKDDKYTNSILIVLFVILP